MQLGGGPGDGGQAIDLRLIGGVVFVQQRFEAREYTLVGYFAGISTRSYHLEGL
jgi:hypothetical protein